MTALLFLSSVAVVMSSTDERHRPAKEAAKRSADQWFVNLQEALQCQSYKDESRIPRNQCPHLVPVTFLASKSDQERIYKLLLDGLTCNHHRTASCELIEPFLIRAINLIKSNDLIFRKMMTNPKNVQSPFQRLHWWTGYRGVRQVLNDVAREGNWDVSQLHRVERNTLLDHQQILQKIKHNPSINHKITIGQDSLLETMKWTSSHLLDLTTQNPSPMDLEIVMTLFQLVMDLRSYVQSRYIHFNVNRYYSLMVQYITKLTMVNLKLAEKAVDIVLDKAPDLICIFWKDRKMYRQQWDAADAVNLQLHRAEVFLLLMDLHDVTPSQFLIPLSRYFQESKNNVMKQRECRAGKCGSLYYFHIKLLMSVIQFCREVGISDLERIHVAEMIWCTTKLVPFEVQEEDATELLIDRTFQELLDKYVQYHNRDLHLPQIGVTV